MKPNTTIQRRLNELMNEYEVSFSDIERNTGMKRQTITKYFTGQSNVPLHFLQKYYLYLKSLRPDKNLNFLYLIDPDYPTKNTTTEKDLKIIGFNQETIDNLYKIVEYKETGVLEEYLNPKKFYETPKLNINKFYILNLILSSPSLKNIVNEMAVLCTKAESGTPKPLNDMYDEIEKIKRLVQDKQADNPKNNEETNFYNELLRNIQLLSLIESQFKNDQKYNLQYDENPDYFNYLKWKLENAVKSLVNDVFNKIIGKK